ncbi:calcium/sodium antiporter [Flavobacteriaceae bacterium Ap0902]|nr:calcium/sodium antiporter [Flavobacteriaceae bacterium Ap0902]
MLIDILYLVGGFLALILGGNWFLKAAVDLASRFGIPKMVIGLTVVSFATSAPELIVSINAAMQGSSGIALGNVIGSNIANIGLVLGVTILITPITVPKNFIRTDWLFLMIATSTLIVFLLLDQYLSRIEGIALIIILIMFIYSLLRKKKSVEIDMDMPIKNETWYMLIIYINLGGLGLWFGAEILVIGAKNIAKSLGVAESVIGLTVVALGTSIPELATSIIAAIKNEKSISFGNLIGSNIFNILSVLGITASIHPFAVDDPRYLNNDVWWMLGFSLVLAPFIYILRRNKLGPIEGSILLSAYILYIYLAF